MKDIILITGASSGFGALTARALAKAGHTVYASMRETETRNAPQVKELEEYAAKHSVDLRPIELDVSSQESCNAAVREIIAKTGRLDVVIHNAGTWSSAQPRLSRQNSSLSCMTSIAKHSTREPRSPASIAQAEERSRDLGVKQ
jgi:NAD(P)-dependent dehydrogenase (short-subunit alcohol dehydrogenase family)